MTVRHGNEPGLGGGISGGGGTVTSRNSIVANNSATSASPNCAGNIDSLGNNLVFGGADTCNFSAGLGDVVNTGDPRLGALQNNGGPIQTMALLPGSAAIDAGNPGTTGSGGNTCAALDQRGQSRVDGNSDGTVRCDIGAFEQVPLPIDLAVALTDGITSPVPGASLTYPLTVTNPVTVAVGNVQVAGTFPAPLTGVAWTCSGAGGSSCAPAGGSMTYTVQATVPPGTAPGTQIAATAAITPPAGVADPSVANNSANDTDTVTSPACSPRPRVVIQVVPAGAGRIQVTLTPSTNDGQAANAIQGVQLGTLQSAVVDFPVQAGVPAAQNGLGSGAQVGLSGPVASLQMFVRRVPPGGTMPFMAPLTVTDTCGEWKTFAGGGTSVP